MEYPRDATFNLSSSTSAPKLVAPSVPQTSVGGAVPHTHYAHSATSVASDPGADEATAPHKKTSTDSGYGSVNSPHLSSSIALWSADQAARRLENVASHSFNSQCRALPLTQADVDAGLRIRTDLAKARNTLSPADYTDSPAEMEVPLHPSSSSSSIPRRAPSVRAILAASSSTASLSPASSISSPQLNAMGEITPLPSPMIMSASNSAFWKPVTPRPGSRDSSINGSTNNLGLSGLSISPRKRKAYRNLTTAGMQSSSNDDASRNHTRHRSVSEYIPETVQIQKPRPIAVSASEAHPSPTTIEPTHKTNMQREEYLAIHRGHVAPTAQPPTPPKDSLRDICESREDALKRLKNSRTELFLARSIKSNKVKRWRAIRQLGQGTFSKVILASRERTLEEDGLTLDNDPFTVRSTKKTKSNGLVAVKVIQLCPTGGADEERMATSLNRELEILKSVSHPSLVRLLASSVEEKRALLVLNYCPGGDLFEVASLMHDLLVPNLIRRIFAELVSAVGYLHSQYIVHRDIKLENVLLRLPTTILPSIPSSSYLTHPHPIISLTDLGLSRHIPRPPESPLLSTRCGSEDYAAPELLMGQPYDGRATDTWALGVLLYALMEGRLPFDPLPGASERERQRSRTAHRVARIEWAWCKFADDEGEWDESKGKEFEGAREIVESLLKRARSRKPLKDVAALEWVKGGIQVEGGLMEEDIEDISDGIL
ncbi:MAG: hypothetical protein M1834_000658 [Cirrosporium novae-zelandiae]|nr:MAG: hypothetical protein M1834_000658 [Cirrosporium novae-zelandiae]